MSPPPRTGFRSRAGVAAAALAALLAPAVAGAQLPGAPAPAVKLAPTDSAAGDLFACALAMDGDLAVAGSVLDDDLGSASGSLYLFSRAGGGWAQTKVVASDGGAGDELGFAVGISGARVAGGAPFRDQIGESSGTVYVFTRRPNGGFAEAKLVPQDLAARDELGRSVAVSGTVVAGGAPGDDDRGSSAGAVYVWDVDPATGAPLGVEKLTAGDGASGDGFGYSVALGGGTLLVGAPYDDDGGAQSGSVYVFERQGGGWVQAAKLTATDRAPGSLFGWSVALSGDRAAIGARLDRGGAAAGGAAYVFERAGGWSQTAKLLPPEPAAGEELGVAVALDGDAVVAGARFATAGGLPRAGAGYLFVDEPDGWVARYRLTSPTPGAGDELGYAVGIAGATVFAGVYRDDDAGNDSGTICAFEELDTGGGAAADLAVTKDDGVTAVDAGGATTYTIVVSNLSPRSVSGARVTDDFPATLDCDWVCSGAGGAVCPAAGTGAIDRLVDLPAGSAATFVAECTVAPFAAGTVSNTATVAAPAGIDDPNPSNDSATDVDTVRPAPFTDVAVTKSDGAVEVSCGATTVYTIVARNAGTRPVAAARVRDTFPEPLSCTWTCAGSGGAACAAAAGSGDFDQTVALPAGAAVTVRATCTVAAGFAGTLSNTATATITSGGPDEVPGNDSATDVDTAVCSGGGADLSVTKSDGVGEVAAGEAVTYTITAANAGPQAVTGARVADEFPLGLSCQWTCAAAGGAACGAAAGTGDIDQAVSLPVGGTATFTAACAVGAFAPDELSNTASISVPPGVIDPVPTNDSATDVDTVLRISDLRVTKTADRATVAIGGSLEYTVTITNDGPSGSAPVQVTDAFPAGLSCAWVCTGTGGGVCGQPSGEGDLLDGVSLAPGGTVTYVADCTVSAGASGNLVNTATATNPSGTVDPNPEDNAATAATSVVAIADLRIAKSAVQAQVIEGQPLVYTLTVTNDGPDDAEDVRLVDLEPGSLAFTSWTCGSIAGSGDLDLLVDLSAGASISCTVTAATVPGFCGDATNVATVEPPESVDDPDFTDRTASDTIRVFPPPANGVGVNLCASKALLTGPHAPGSTVIYQLLLFNGGPLPLLDGPIDELIDDVPPEVAVTSVTADTGLADTMGNLVTWNGDLPPGVVATVTITGVVDGQVGQTVANQGFFSDFASGQTVPTDDPATQAPIDPTVFTIGGVLDIPALGGFGLVALAALLAAAALRRLRRTRH